MLKPFATRLPNIKELRVEGPRSFLMPNLTTSSEIIASARRPSGLTFQVRRHRPGVIEMPALESTLLSVHIGSATQVDCYRAARHFSGTSVHGDIDIIPRGTPVRWNLVGEDDRAILVILPQSVLDEAVSNSPMQAHEVSNRFQVRDPVLESLAMMAAREIQDGLPSGPSYLDGIGLALASRLRACHSAPIGARTADNEGLNGYRLKLVLSYIEDRLGSNLTVQEISRAAGLSRSHLTKLFRQTIGMPVHQHILGRRVERAKTLLQETTLPMAEVALAVGCAHQSHMARHMVRILGIRPLEFRQMSGGHR